VRGRALNRRFARGSAVPSILSVFRFALGERKTKYKKKKSTAANP